ncbi:MAG: hypothetical protein NUV76_12175 [Candidatus Kuenenia sp.]|nr:hypothetical protein [Candidatus Kuenenia sp.]
MGKGAGSSNQTVTTNLLPDYAQPYVEAYLTKMTELSNLGYATYPGATYAEQNTNELDGITALATRGRNSSPLITKSKTLLQNILDGLKFNINPKIDAAYSKRAENIVKEFEEDTLPRLNQRFNLTNNFASDSHHWAQSKAAEAVMAKLQEFGMDLYFKDYLSERLLQINSLSDAKQYGEQEVTDAEILRSAGVLDREWQQGKLEDTYKKWRDEIERIIKRLEILGNGVRTIVGAQEEETHPFYRPSPISQIAGLALAGAGMFAMVRGMSADKANLSQMKEQSALESSFSRGFGGW